MVNQFSRQLGKLMFGLSPKKLLILTYHRVLRERDPLRPSEPTGHEFETQMRWLRSIGDVLTLEEAIERLVENRLRQHTSVVTFDDGYADNVDVALPILESLGLRATFFIATGFLNGGIMWNDMIIESVRTSKAEKFHSDALDISGELTSGAGKLELIRQLITTVKHLPVADRTALVDNFREELKHPCVSSPMMTDSQVRALHAAGMEIGAHTVNHPILSALPDGVAKQEIVEGKNQLERIIGHSVTSFAYPNGKPEQDFNQSHKKLVAQAGFSRAVSTAFGVVDSQSDYWALPRASVWGGSTAKLTGQLSRILLRAWLTKNQRSNSTQSGNTER